MKKFLCTAAAALPLTAFAAHPLVTDDTGTQGNGGWQYEFNVERTSSQDDIGRVRTVGQTLTRGFGDNVDVYVGVPYTKLQNSTDDQGSGIGDTELGVKWRFFQSGPFSIGVRPSLTMPTGNYRKSLGNGRVNANLALIGQAELGRWTLLANLGESYQPNKLGNRDNIWQASAAAIFQPTEKWQLVGELGTSRQPEPGNTVQPVFATVGAIYSPNKTVDLDLGYRKALSRQPDDHALMAGLTLHW